MASAVVPIRLALAPIADAAKDTTHSNVLDGLTFLTLGQSLSKTRALPFLTSDIFGIFRNGSGDPKHCVEYRVIWCD